MEEVTLGEWMVGWEGRVRWPAEVRVRQGRIDAALYFCAIGRCEAGEKSPGACNVSSCASVYHLYILFLICRAILVDCLLANWLTISSAKILVQNGTSVTGYSTIRCRCL
jgi:hypothetical protein